MFPILSPPFYAWWVALDLIDLPPELRHAIEEARRAARDDVSVGPRATHPFVSPLTDEERAAVRAAIDEGAYAAAVAAVVADDPELASD